MEWVSSAFSVNRDILKIDDSHVSSCEQSMGKHLPSPLRTKILAAARRQRRSCVPRRDRRARACLRQIAARLELPRAARAAVGRTLEADWLDLAPSRCAPPTPAQTRPAR